MQNLTMPAGTAFCLELAPVAWFAWAPERLKRIGESWPSAFRVVLPGLLAAPYLLVSLSQHIFRWSWFALYLTLPVAAAWLFLRAAVADPAQRGNWRDAFVLLLLGLAVDLRWFDSAWPPGLRALNELLLVDIGLYGILAIRRLSGCGFDFRLCWTDWKTGLRELAFFTPIVLLLGLALGFIHPHRNLPAILPAILRWILILLFTAVPEELYFRSWIQNLLERRLGRRISLILASVLFGLSHFNKRSAHFNWRYVLLASIAGVFYGRAWREQRRVAASGITHATVDWIWSLWF